jgi:predicted AlkP superfamily pyrophosphatase or phosphodiesterase
MDSMSNLAGLSNSIFSSLGLASASNPLAIGASPGARECFVLIDGYGADALAKYGAAFPIFSQMKSLPSLTAHFPSTTATNLSSLGTGVLPGAHGMLGYTVRVPRSGEPGRLLNSLKWDERVDPITWQSIPTLFERAVHDQIHVGHVAAKRYEGSGFTQAALRGATYMGANHLPEMVSETVRALSQPRSFAYVYINNLDAAGHDAGVGSEKWLEALKIVSDLLVALHNALPAGTRIWMTSDHGMVNSENHLVMGVDNNLMANISLVGGEPRARHLYLQAGALDETAALWRETLDGRARIYTKSEAISEGLFGISVSADSEDRMGDLIVIPNTDLILIDPERVKQESGMVGHHGGLTDIETQVPLLTATV